MKTNVKLIKSNKNRLNQDNLRNKAIIKGVNLLLPETVYLSKDTKFGKNIISRFLLEYGNSIEDTNCTYMFVQVVHVHASAGPSGPWPLARLALSQSLPTIAVLAGTFARCLPPFDS